MYILAPLTGFNLRLITSSATCNCLAVNRAPFPLIRIPHSPKANVVPFVDPPIGIGMVPLCRLTYLTLRGASWERFRVIIFKAVEGDGERTADGVLNVCRSDESKGNMVPVTLMSLSAEEIREGVTVTTHPQRRQR